MGAACRLMVANEPGDLQPDCSKPHQESAGHLFNADVRSPVRHQCQYQHQQQNVHTSNPGSLANIIHPPNILLHTGKMCSGGAQQRKRVLIMLTVQRLPLHQAAKQNHTVAQPRNPATARILLLPIDILKYTLYKL
jgi:hypothetical protein